MQTFLDDDQIEDGEVLIDDAAANWLASTLAVSVRVKSARSVLQKEANATGRQHTLLHPETLFVAAASYAHDVTLKRETIDLEGLLNGQMNFVYAHFKEQSKTAQIQKGLKWTNFNVNITYSNKR